MPIPKNIIVCDYSFEMIQCLSTGLRQGWDMQGQKGRLSYLSRDAPMYLQTNALWAQCGSGA